MPGRENVPRAVAAHEPNRTCQRADIRIEINPRARRLGGRVLKEAVLARKTVQEIRRVSIETSGLITLMEDGIAKAARGKVSLPEVMRRLPRIVKPRPLHELRRLLGE